MKIALSVLFAIMFISLAHAGVQTIQNWNGGTVKMKASSCPSKCSGYSADASCKSGESIKACPAAGCSHYIKCVK